ncbi:hypothetical protein L208DRAFT_1381099 [Tricholoma matsutake]|nr:hypothetical protein L208DRAFT_1381099 [Tricholoma matsutake 945]
MSPTTLPHGGQEGTKWPPSTKVWQSSCPTTLTKPNPLSPHVANALLVPTSPCHPCLPTVQEPAEHMLHKAMPIIWYLSEPICPLLDEEVYWVVMEGEQPGVYLGKDVARHVMGCHGKVKKAATSEQANYLFICKYMSGRVVMTGQ